jgi:hypothetical protein
MCIVRKFPPVWKIHFSNQNYWNDGEKSKYLLGAHGNFRLCAWKGDSCDKKKHSVHLVFVKLFLLGQSIQLRRKGRPRSRSYICLFSLRHFVEILSEELGSQIQNTLNAARRCRLLLGRKMN